ncbi:MAG: glycerol-3-phosphate acyltransferase, partial [Clostridiaceae bacterium]|nr:glycerol-3-phosphate acyltransferase [Clostridiaceae bacterium]
MPEIIVIVFSSIIGYLLGSVNTSIIIGKIVYKTDVREHGSGNAGATNVLRTFGKTAALAVVAGDFLKGVLAC